MMVYVFGGFIAIVILMAVAWAVSASSKRRELQEAAWTPPVEYGAPTIQVMPSGFDVCAIRIGIDGRASKFVQTELDAIMRTYDANLPEQRARCMREVSIMLRRVRDSWVYGGADNEPMRPRQAALTAYMRLLDDARTRVRNASAPTAPPSGPPISLVVVSIIVATRGELISVTDLATGEDLRRALEAVIHRPPDDLIGFDVVWEPREDGQTVSSIELEAAYRTAELHQLQSVASGKTFCTYCKGPFPMELVTCPHCGAPAREARAS